MRLNGSLLILGALLLPLVAAPAALAATGVPVCPRDAPDAVECHDKVLRPGTDHLFLVVRAPEGDARVAVQEPDEDAPGAPLAEAGYARYGDGPLGEEVVTAQVGCCDAPSWFAGAHLAPQGHDARAGTSSPWRSASASYATSVAGHDLRAQAGTFHFWMLQYFYVEAFVDGERHGFFEAVPMPLP